MAVAPLVAVAATGLAGFAAGKALAQKPPPQPTVPELPKAPESLAATQTEIAKRRNRTLLFADQGTSRGSTLLTSGTGAGSPAPTARSTLLGM